jgi:hypothetical protein
LADLVDDAAQVAVSLDIAPDEHYRNVSAWRKSALINIANMGFFSSDRSIADYCRDIWYISISCRLKKADTPFRCIGFRYLLNA